MTKHKLTVLIILGALTITAFPGCIKPDLKPRFTPAWESFDPDDERWIKSNEVLVVADCQLHNLYSKAIPERNLSAEAAASTAIRPPQLDMFAGDVLRYITTTGCPDSKTIVHLGDALDLACEGEWTEFAEVMNASGKPWVVAPGNHDFFYFGVYDPHRTKLWDDACYGSGDPLTKDRYIPLYVATLLLQKRPRLCCARRCPRDRRAPYTAGSRAHEPNPRRVRVEDRFGRREIPDFDLLGHRSR